MCEVRKTTNDLKSAGRNSVLKAPVTGVSKRSGEMEGRAVVEQGDQERPGAGGGAEGFRPWFHYAAAGEVCLMRQGMHMCGFLKLRAEL